MVAKGRRLSAMVFVAGAQLAIIGQMQFSVPRLRLRLRKLAARKASYRQDRQVRKG